jgi:aspartyl-tRNA synthetase
MIKLSDEEYVNGLVKKLEFLLDNTDLFNDAQIEVINNRLEVFMEHLDSYVDYIKSCDEVEDETQLSEREYIYHRFTDLTDELLKENFPYREKKLLKFMRKIFIREDF